MHVRSFSRESILSLSALGIVFVFASLFVGVTAEPFNPFRGLTPETLSTISPHVAFLSDAQIIRSFHILRQGLSSHDQEILVHFSDDDILTVVRNKDGAAALLASLTDEQHSAVQHFLAQMSKRPSREQETVSHRPLPGDYIPGQGPTNGPPPTPGAQMFLGWGGSSPSYCQQPSRAPGGSCTTGRTTCIDGGRSCSYTCVGGAWSPATGVQCESGCNMQGTNCA